MIYDDDPIPANYMFQDHKDQEGWDALDSQNILLEFVAEFNLDKDLLKFLNKKVDERLDKEESQDHTCECECCGNSRGTQNKHACPYKVEIEGNADPYCNCCDNCVGTCSDEI